MSVANGYAWLLAAHPGSRRALCLSKEWPASHSPASSRPPQFTKLVYR